VPFEALSLFVGSQKGKEWAGGTRDVTGVKVFWFFPLFNGGKQKEKKRGRPLQQEQTKY